MENYRQKHRFVLATDLGIGSNGWAIIDLDAHRVEDLGSLTVVSNFSLTKSLKTLIISILLSFFIG